MPPTCPLLPRQPRRPAVRARPGALARWAAAGLLALALAGVCAAESLRVEISGVSGEQKANVEGFVSIYRERDDKDLSASRVRMLHERAPEEIREALAPFGFYRVGVEGELSETEDGGWLARYRIDPGEPIPLGVVDVQVSGPGAEEPGRPGAGMETGQPLSHSAYEGAKKRLKGFYEARGYLEARYAHSEVLVDTEAYSADVSLHLDTGPQFYFGDVRFLQEGFDPDFLQRYVTFEEGDPFRYADLLALQGALNNTDFFSVVEVTPRVSEVADQRVPIEVKVDRNLPNRYRIGFGFATDTGPRVTFDWTRRYIGTKGHSASALLSLSPKIQRLEGGYRVPLADPRREFLSFTASAENYDTTSRTGSVLSLRASHDQFSGNWQRTLGIDYDFEDPRTEGDDPTFTLVPNVSWVWKVQDDPINTRRGARIDLRLLGAARPVLSNSTFLQGHARAKGVYSPLDGWRLIGRAEVGASLASDVREIPLSRRFYAGGDSSVRGYAFEDLSPRDDQGERTGGRHLVSASVEVERRIVEKWAVAAFYDTGNAFDDFRALDLASGVGLGLRWLSPVGPVRVDVARAIEDQSFRLHLVIGPDL